MRLLLTMLISFVAPLVAFYWGYAMGKRDAWVDMIEICRRCSEKEEAK